jgi:hypothetical protein
MVIFLGFVRRNPLYVPLRITHCKGTVFQIYKLTTPDPLAWVGIVKILNTAAACYRRTWQPEGPAQDGHGLPMAGWGSAVATIRSLWKGRGVSSLWVVV